jgi:hypothetical protein
MLVKHIGIRQLKINIKKSEIKFIFVKKIEKFMKIVIGQYISVLFMVWKV